MINYLPIMIMAITALVAMLIRALRGSHALIASLSVAGLLITFASTCALNYQSAAHPPYSSLLIIDAFGLFMMQLILLFMLMIVILGFDYWQKQSVPPCEFYLSLLLSSTGALIMVTSGHLASFFLGLELMTIPLYCAISYFTHQRKGLEAGVKYIILAGASTALLLYGMALIYAEVGTMNFALIAEQLSVGLLSDRLLFIAGFSLICVAIGFKISAVPFHLWTPDVYDGAPLPATAYLATVSKSAAIALFFRLWLSLYPNVAQEASWIIALMAVLSMVIGNLLALRQENIKRLLGYSSIAHFGYILMATLSLGAIGTNALLFYLSAYGATTLLIFGVLMCLSSAHEDVSSVDELRGLIRTRPWLGMALLLGFLSLMGIPFTAIFMAKLLVILAGVHSSHWLMLIALIISSIIGLVVYLRLATILFDTRDSMVNARVRLTPWATSALAMLALTAVVLGIWPTLITNEMPVLESKTLTAD